MLFSEINPYIRYARYENLDENFRFDESVALDARLFYAVNGYGKIKVNGKDYTMTPYSLLIINSGIPYTYCQAESSISYIALNFDYTQAAVSHRLPIPPVSRDKFTKDMLLDAVNFDDAEFLSGVLYIREIPSIHQKLSEIVNEYTKKLLYYETKIGHILAECLSDALRQLKAKNTVNKQCTGNILSYIQDHFNHTLTNASLGEKFGYHPNYINQLIKGATGMSLHQYVIHLRMICAVNLLENTSLPVGEIALRCGFCDIAYFSQYFKKYFGISPSKYRSS